MYLLEINFSVCTITTGTLAHSFSQIPSSGCGMEVSSREEWEELFTSIPSSPKQRALPYGVGYWIQCSMGSLTRHHIHVSMETYSSKWTQEQQVCSKILLRNIRFLIFATRNDIFQMSHYQPASTPLSQPNSACTTTSQLEIGHSNVPPINSFCGTRHTRLHVHL